MACKCFIVPQDVLLRFASDPTLSEELRRNFSYTAVVSDKIRAVRQQQETLTLTTMQFPQPIPVPIAIPGPHPPIHLLPACNAYTCNHGTTLPGTQVANPGTSADGSVKRAYTESEAVAKFYWDNFQRDSVDNHHLTLVSSVHYSSNFDNAFWNGSQMVYGDGDGQMFLDFTLGNDVIGHELTHGVTQYTLGLAYANESGGLNESISDVFGSMFRQWQANHDVNAADWLIGHDIMGPASIKKGYTCLRDMSNPAAAHCLAAQPTNYSQYHPGMDPHYSSGIPNFAFYKAAKALGGKSWVPGGVGQIWYKVVSGSGTQPNMTMKQFADATRNASASNASLLTAINSAWVAVGL